MKYTWEYSDNVEMWCHDEFDTVEDCIEDAKENYDVKVGDTIAIGKVVPYEPQVWASGVLEDLEQQVYDQCGEAAEDWDTFIYKEDKDKLDELSDQLTDVVKAWLKKYKREPNFSKVENIMVVEVN